MLTYTFAGSAIAFTSVLIILIFRDFRQHKVALIFSLLLIAVLAFLLHPFTEVPFTKLTRDIQTAIPALFWLTCRFSFTDKDNVRSPFILLALFSFAMPAVFGFFTTHQEATGWVLLFGWEIPQLCEFILLGGGFWDVLSNWRNDLIETRRRVRAAVMGIAGITILWVVTSLNFQLGGTLDRLLIVNMGLLFSCYFLLEGKKGVLFGMIDKVNTVEIQAKIKTRQSLSNDMRKVEQLIADGFHRTEKITLKDVAKALQMPEYKCRELINQELGYRNFNEFINELRIADACDLLLEDLTTPVSNIALDIGYRTLSSFNRAFKDIKDQSPTQFRSENSADK